MSESSMFVFGTLIVVFACFMKTTYKRVYQTSSLNSKRYLVRSHDSRNYQIKSANLRVKK